MLAISRDTDVLNQPEEDYFMRIMLNSILIVCIMCCLAITVASTTEKATDDTQRLIALMKNDDGYTRQEVLKKLALIKDPRVIAPLINALRDEEYGIRRDAAIALGQSIHRDKKSVMPLIAALRDDQPDVREYAAEALGKLNDPRAIKPLRIASHDKQSSVRDAATRALQQIKPPPTVDELITKAGDKDPAVRWEAVQALGRNEDARVLAPLITALHDGKFSVAEAAAVALNRRGWKPTDKQTLARWTVLLGQWEDARRIGREAVPPLLEALESNVFTGRKAAAETLGAIRDVRAMDALFDMAVRDSSSDVEVAAGKALVNIGDPAVDYLLEKLKMKYLTAIQLLGDSRSTRAIEPLLVLLSDEEELASVRIAAANALARFGQPVAAKAIDPLLVLLSEKECASDRIAAATTLARFGQPAAAKLTKCLASNDPEKRFAAAYAIVTMRPHHPAATAVLAEILTKRNLPALIEYYRYFIRIGGPGTEPILIEALNAQSNNAMCLAFLNSGNTKLEKAARLWAKKNDLFVVSYPSFGGQMAWGSGR